MKFSKYFMLAGAAAMLTACSSEEPFVPQGDPMTEEIANNDTYALISLAMPEATGTRAAESVTSGIESEYKVANGTLLLWEKGATEGDAVYVGKSDFSGAWQDAGKIDLTRQATIQLGFAKGTFEAGKEYAGVVVLNYNPANYPFPTEGQKFSAWKATNNTAEFTYKANGLTYLTMASAPQYDEDTNTTSVLVDIPHENVKTSFEELKPELIIDGFYVQRNAAKVTVTAQNKYNLSGAYEGSAVTINGWATDVKATASFPIQNHDGLTIDAAWISNDTKFPSFTRVHWGKSAFYGEEYVKANYTYLTAIPSTKPAYEYVKENTLKYDEQVYNRTTRVVLKATYSVGDAAATSLVKIGNNTTLYTVADFVKDVNAKLTALNMGDVTATAKNVNAGGTKSLKEMVTIASEDGTEIDDTKYNTVAAQLGLTTAVAKELAFYADGVCYYAVRLRHFDDTERPLGKDIDAVGDYEAKHEGRYGVLRNNWYEVTVNSISKIGQPTIPPVDPEDPDDGPIPDDKETDESDAISFSIKMLNWAKRSQNVNL